MKATKRNKEYNIDESQQKAYLDRGFDILDDKGNVVAYGRGKTVPYEAHMDAVKEIEHLQEVAAQRSKEIEALKADLESKKAELETAKKNANKSKAEIAAEKKAAAAAADAQEEPKTEVAPEAGE